MVQDELYDILQWDKYGKKSKTLYKWLSRSWEHSIWDRKKLYEREKLGLDESHKEWHKCEFWNKQENIYDTKSLNDMNHIHDNTVNNIAECSLLHHILNTSKCTNIYIYPRFPYYTWMYEYM